MKRMSLFAVLSFCLLVPSWLMAQTYDHGEVGAFADYLRFSPTNPEINFVGLGGRVGINVNPYVAMEGEMSYDFERNFTTVTSTLWPRPSCCPGPFDPNVNLTIDVAVQR
jgi:hypothetical protein